MDTTEIKDKTKIYSKLAELYRDLDLLQYRRQCNEDVVLHDTRDITITDNTICQSIYDITINNLIEEINAYEMKLGNASEYIPEVCELICKPNEHIYVVFNNGEEDDFNENMSCADRTKYGWRLRSRLGSLIITRFREDEIRMIGVKRNVSCTK